MRRPVALASSAALAAAAQTASLWVLTHAVALRLPIAFALAFAAGYVALFAGIHVLTPSGSRIPLGTRLRRNRLFGIAAFVLMEGVVYLCGLLDLNLTTTNTAVLLAIICWVALGCSVVRRET